jgi:NTE family protein
MSKSKPVTALALGGGAARGWAHVGVIRALEEANIPIDMVCGTSIGALVGAAYAAGELDRFEQWVKTLSLMDVLGFMDVSLGGGLIKGEKLMAFFQKTFTDRPIESLAMPFAAVATDLRTGAEVWCRDGSTAQAVRASMALPGLLTPVRHDARMLVDGGLVNPVPVSLARAMGADIVIAVDLNADIIGRHLDSTKAPSGLDLDNPVSAWLKRMQDRVASQWPSLVDNETPPLPSMFDVIASSVNIMQVRITRSRMAGEPADALVTPRLAMLGLMDFHRAQDSITEGRRALTRSLPMIKAAIDGT